MPINIIISCPIIIKRILGKEYRDPKSI